MKKCLIAVVMLLLISVSLKADIVTTESYKDIDSYDIVGEFDKDLDERVSYGSFNIVLGEIYSKYSTQLIIPNGALLGCAFSRDNFFEGKLTKPICNVISFTLGGDKVTLNISKLEMTTEGGSKVIGPDIKKGLKVKLKIAGITKINIISGMPKPVPIQTVPEGELGNSNAVQSGSAQVQQQPQPQNQLGAVEQKQGQKSQPQATGMPQPTN